MGYVWQTSAEAGRGLIWDGGMETTDQKKEPKQWHMHVINKHATDNSFKNRDYLKEVINHY